jgi:aspartyl-tRNA(Asn)/glutamyl-tRNA(Gln) amidotransferase subunit A
MKMPGSIGEAAAGLRSGQLTSVELVSGCMDRMDRHEASLGAVVGRCDDAALAAAALADRELGSGHDRGPLHGIPIGIKDVLATADLPTTAQSLAMLPGYQGFDSAAAELLRAAGAIIVAKAACSEFACGTPDGNLPFRFPRNPWDAHRWAGGSSGGSASGLQAGFFLGAVGTDTGGSIRAPAAFCGITGLKPTFGAVSRHGCVPLSNSMDHVGPMARTAADCAILLAALAGEDPRDAATVGFRGGDYPAALSGDLTDLTVGVDGNSHARVGVPDEMLALFDAAVSVLESAGARVVEVALPFTNELYAAVRVVMAAEAFEAHRTNLQEQWDRYGRPTRLSLSKGAFISGADYVRASRIIAKSKELYADALAGTDLVASPTCPIVACRFEEIGTAVVNSAPLLTTQWNGLGMPAISVPMGMVDTPGANSGLPAGLQLAGARGQDALVLRAADAYQRRTGWHALTPDRFN